MTEPSGTRITTPLDVTNRLKAHETSEADGGPLEPEQKTEPGINVEAAQQQLADIQEQISEGQLAVMRNAIAVRVGLSPEDRDILLTGRDAATLEAQAERLEKYGFGRPPGNVAPREGQAVSAPTHVDRDMREFIDNLFGNDVW